MSNYPKEWVEEAFEWLKSVRLVDDMDAELRKDAVKMLDALHDIGALKEIPKPREFWILNDTVELSVSDTPPKAKEDWYEVIHVKEILENEDA